MANKGDCSRLAARFFLISFRYKLYPMNLWEYLSTFLILIAFLISLYRLRAICRLAINCQPSQAVDNRLVKANARQTKVRYY